MVFNPASSTKIFTAIAALKYLGPTHSFQTQILIPQQDQLGETISGNLYFKFNGDPTFTVDDLQKMINVLGQKGIHAIHGNIIIDDIALGGANWAPGISWDTLPTHWAAPATAIVLNENYFDAVLSSNNKINAPATLKIMPIFSGATITNQTIVRQPQAWECPLELSMDSRNNYTITGCLDPKVNSLPLKIAYSNPRMALKNTLMRLFQKEGITYSGQIIFAKHQVMPKY